MEDNDHGSAFYDVDQLKQYMKMYQVTFEERDQVLRDFQGSDATLLWVADVATLLADGLRAAARRLSTPPTSDADERPTPDEHTPDQQEPERPPGDDEGNGR